MVDALEKEFLTEISELSHEKQQKLCTLWYNAVAAKEVHIDPVNKEPHGVSSLQSSRGVPSPPQPTQMQPLINVPSPPQPTQMQPQINTVIIQRENISLIRVGQQEIPLTEVASKYIAYMVLEVHNYTIGELFDRCYETKMVDALEKEFLMEISELSHEKQPNFPRRKTLIELPSANLMVELELLRSLNALNSVSIVYRCAP